MFVRERWNVYDHPHLIDRLSTLPDQLRWMEEAGFEGVGVFWARADTRFLAATGR